MEQEQDRNKTGPLHVPVPTMAPRIITHTTSYLTSYMLTDLSIIHSLRGGLSNISFCIFPLFAPIFVLL